MKMPNPVQPLWCWQNWQLFFTLTAIALFCLISSSLFPGLSYAYTILTPVSSQKIMIQARRPQSTLIIKLTAKDNPDSLQVVTAKSRSGSGQTIESSARYKKDGVSYIHYRLPLKRGNNTFVISPGGERLKISYKPVRTLLGVNFEDPKAFLFHRTAVIPKECSTCHSEKLPADAGLDVKRLKKNADYSPVCFSCHRKLLSKNEWLHGPTANVYCMSCHRKGTGNTRITMLTGRVDEVCFQCHINKKKFKNLKHVHGPVGTGDCTICHDPHGDANKFQLWADSKIDLCIGCHGDKKNVSKKTIGFYLHGIILGGGCVACHNPHATDYRFQLSKSINELCISCHQGLAGVTKGHPVGNHPLSGKDDPRRKGRELSCTSCHDPHGSSYKFLLIGDILGGNVCTKCHDT